MESKHLLMVLGGAAVLGLGYWFWKDQKDAQALANAQAKGATPVSYNPQGLPVGGIDPATLPPPIPWVNPLEAAANQARADKAAAKVRQASTSTFMPAFYGPSQ